MSIRDFVARRLKPLSSVPIPSAPLSPPPLPEEITRLVDPPAFNTRESDPEVCAENDSPFFHWDIETRSVAKLGKGKFAVGVRAYAEHPSTEVLCVAFARGDGPVDLWLPGQPIPDVVLRAATNPGCRWIAHNAAFERAILEHVLTPRHGWPVVPTDRHICTMALALSHAYPGGLDAAATALGLVNRKDVAREKEVKKMWSPRKPRRGEDSTKIYWVDTPELRASLHAYNRQDVVAERELHQRLSALSPAEQEVWVIDQDINDLGVHIDVDLATAASAMAARTMADLHERMNIETGGAVTAATQVKALKTWLKSQGVMLPRRPKKQKGGTSWEDCLDEDDIGRLLAGDLPTPAARAALEIRVLAAQTAVSKFDKMLRTRCVDGRVRNLYRAYGAVTGRWSGEGFQPQNLKRPEILRTDALIEEAITIVLAGDYEGAKARYGDVLRMLGDLSRSMLIPAPGCRFIVGDFSTIEARVLALLAGDFDKLARFRDFDAGTGRDLYCITAEKVLGLDHVEEKSPERQLGKTFELGLGYQMGNGRLLTTIRSARVPGTEGTTEVDTARWVSRWRAANPKIVALWAALDASATTAVRTPGAIVSCGVLKFALVDGVLLLKLPSGRELSYPAPRIEPGKFGRDAVVFTDMEAGRRRGRHMYGGAWAENATSAVARDLLVEAMKRLQAAGYVLALHTHDEVVCEMPIGEGNLAEFKRLLVAAPEWADPALPIAAKVFESDRFKKD